jgi:pyridoxine 5-phosphate synthase
VTALSVNLNKIALLRNSRAGDSPSVIAAAETVINSGAQGITVHPRPDQRHIRPADVGALAQLLEAYPNIEFNIEGNPAAGPRDNGYPGFDALIESARPHQATLVPDSESQLTSDHGWDLSGDNSTLTETIARYQDWGARVSLFMDPEPQQIAAAKVCGADRIELYTGPFAATVARFGTEHEETRQAFSTYRAAAEFAADQGLGVNAGHDLDTENLPLFNQIQGLLEVSIGHALIKDALEVGLSAAVAAYLAALQQDIP